MKIGLQFKIARIEAEMTQEQVSRALGITEKTISNIENGNANFKYSTGARLAELYEFELNLNKLITPKGE